MLLLLTPLKHFRVVSGTPSLPITITFPVARSSAVTVATVLGSASMKSSAACRQAATTTATIVAPKKFPRHGVAPAESPDGLALARTQSVHLDVVPVALDAFVFLANTENPVRNLATSQIRDIYAGKIEDWKVVGGLKRGITAYQREENSGSQQLMRDLVMKDVPFKKDRRVAIATATGRKPDEPCLSGTDVG